MANEIEHTNKSKRTQAVKPKVDLTLGASAPEWIISTIIGATSGIVAAAVTIRDRFYEELKTRPHYKDMFAAHADNLDKIDARNVGKAWHINAKEIDDAKEKFGNKIIKELEERDGIFSKGPKGLTYGTYQRYQFAGKASAGRIFFNAVVGTVIGAAATLSFFNGLASRQQIRTIAENTNRINDQLEKQLPVTHTESKSTHTASPETRVNGVNHVNRVNAEQEIEMPSRA